MTITIIRKNYNNSNNDNNHNNDDNDENQNLHSCKNIKSLKENKKCSRKSNSCLLKRGVNVREAMFYWNAKVAKFKYRK